MKFQIRPNSKAEEKRRSTTAISSAPGSQIPMARLSGNIRHQAQLVSAAPVSRNISLSVTCIAIDGSISAMTNTIIGMT